MGYNSYRKRSYSRSKSQDRSYAEEMASLEESFDRLSAYGWFISSRLDSAYKVFHEYGIELRLSNHSAENKYHDLSGDSSFLLVNVRLSKLEFVDYIDNHKYESLFRLLSQLDLSGYRFINVNGTTVNCFYKGFKTKKDTFDLRDVG